MLDFFSKRNRKSDSKGTQSSKAMSNARKRSLFLESLEDRRLLAADFSISTAADANEAGSVAGQFTVLGTGTTTVDQVINLTIAGTATDGGTDYDSIGATVTVPAGTDPSATIDVQGIVDDALFEGDETVIVTLASLVPTADANTINGGSNTATVEIEDNDTAVVTVTVQDGTASETGPDDGAFRVSLDKTNNTGGTITVNYTMTGTATNGTDYATVAGTGNNTLNVRSRIATIAFDVCPHERVL